MKTIALYAVIALIVVGVAIRVITGVIFKFFWPIVFIIAGYFLYVKYIKK